MPSEIKYFNECKEINDLINSGQEKKARDELIKLLDKVKTNEYSELLNHLIRCLGLFPYMQPDSCLWEDNLVRNCFETKVSNKESVVLHREQSLLLKKLLERKNIVVSAPTSFGKSFVIDSFIEIQKPKNVMIIVPTIALTDETRRRIYKRFSNEYNIITTVDSEIKDKNIFIFPQERALSYITKLAELDILIIDEFYKSSSEFEPDRSSSLVKAMLKLGGKAKQRYYIAPNISNIQENSFTEDMEILNLDFNTVYLEIHKNCFKRNEEKEKENYIVHLVREEIDEKTLIYAGTHSNIKHLGELFVDRLNNNHSLLLHEFSGWLKENYTDDWILPQLIKKGLGIHTGRIHRALSQLQIKLFEEDTGLKYIISTSSIIEGVNTSAKNVILWTQMNGRTNLNSFSYKNVIGRAGRMFKYFIGDIYVLEEPPEDEVVQLNIEFPEKILGDLDIEKSSSLLTKEQIAKIKEYEQEMSNILGKETFKELKDSSAFQIPDSYLIKKIAEDIYTNKTDWEALKYLNSDNPEYWTKILYKILKRKWFKCSKEYSAFVEFIKVVSNNWNKTIKELLDELRPHKITIDDFFSLERNITFDFSAVLKDINKLQLKILNNKATDISKFINKVSSAFLPHVVYELEEYGLPRMISKKIQKAGIIDFENENYMLNDVIYKLKNLGKEKIAETINANYFEKYIIDYFYDGITVE